MKAKTSVQCSCEFVWIDCFNSVSAIDYNCKLRCEVCIFSIIFFLKGAKIKQNPSFDEVFMQQLECFCGPYNPTNILEILLILSTFKWSFTLCIEGNDQCCNTHICFYLYLIWNTIVSNLVHLFLGSYWVRKTKTIIVFTAVFIAAFLFSLVELSG